MGSQLVQSQNIALVLILPLTRATGLVAYLIVSSVLAIANVSLTDGCILKICHVFVDDAVIVILKGFEKWGKKIGTVIGGSILQVVLVPSAKLID